MRPSDNSEFLSNVNSIIAEDWPEMINGMLYVGKDNHLELEYYGSSNGKQFELNYDDSIRCIHCIRDNTECIGDHPPLPLKCLDDFLRHISLLCESGPIHGLSIFKDEYKGVFHPQIYCSSPPKKA